MYEIEEYLTEDGASPFGEWLRTLKDSRARMRLLARLDRASLGNLGDWRACLMPRALPSSVTPMGPRVYFSFISGKIILLLAGSTKRDQKRSIRRAITYLHDYRRRTGS